MPPSNPLPLFSPARYLEMQAQFNQDLWPAHLLVYALALAVLALAWSRRPWAWRGAAALLAAFWLSVAVLFLGLHFTRLHPGGLLFTALFALGGLALLRECLRPAPAPILAPSLDGPGVLGALLVLHSLLGHPWLSNFLDHPWPRMGLLGLAPGPTVLFTLGLLFWTKGRLNGLLLLACGLWTLLGFLLAVELGLKEDVFVLPIGLAAACLLLPRALRPVSSGT